MPKVEIIAVGTELLLGQLVDTNTPFIAQHLAEAGIDVFALHSVGDNRVRIAAAVDAALERADGVITSGGLGPTVDDLTREGASDALGVDCVRDEAAIARMESFFASIDRPMRENNRKQADIPRGATVLENPSGTAPGFIATRSNGKFVACLPGVPHEMKRMLVEQLLPRLRERLQTQEHIVTRILHVTGLGESEIDHRIDDLFRGSENPKLAILAHMGVCDVKIMAKVRDDERAREMIAPLETEVRARLQGHVFGSDGATLPQAVVARLREREWKMSVAESCTGGRVAAAITSVPGASDVFAGGVVAYENEAKVALLGVDANRLAEQGAVSEETALAMSRGTQERFGTQVALATTGIAGPSGGTKEKPVGLVWFALVWPGGKRTLYRNFPGNREEVQVRATQASLSLLWQSF